MTTVLIENGNTLLILMKCRCANSVAQFRGMSGFKSTLSSSTNGLFARDTFPNPLPGKLEWERIDQRLRLVTPGTKLGPSELLAPFGAGGTRRGLVAVRRVPFRQFRRE
jgi:hypothetical protein